MRKRIGPVSIVLFALLLIGIVYQIRNGSRELLIPVILIAVVFILYKFPPSRFRTSSSDAARYRQAAAKSQSRRQARPADKAPRKPAPFRVIEGSKKRDDEPPTYH
ncbi:hypothetical protein J19TS2_13840 [Cohnella xylanilytica]|uniref:Uncharacterized protein n=1 Tax=Cohnella xylanilytica TaxID=557555 RepID=A0A841TXJ9_9BACL|nr:hypothetical protein [Cohnella xylanilytica]MBB6692986.1 hypothetical protein [Cohnella xylanilytica]GIO11829.1 hypothetical protein J19TS2_13840 [Cohnella xylanilytica]